MSKFRSRSTLAEAENPSAACGGAAPNHAASDPHLGGRSTTRGAAVHPRSSRHGDSPSADSHSMEPSEVSKQGARKHRGGSSSDGEDHLPAVPKQPHRRKTKGSSSSRPKAAERANGLGSEKQRSDSSMPASDREEPK